MQYEVRIGSVAEAIEIERQIPEFDRNRTEADYFNKLQDRRFLILVAESNGKLLGYKVGYEISNSEFYSWLGAVLPEYRGLKIASALRNFQENWAISHGYKSIRVNSYNKFSSMLQMLISNDYKICSFEKHEDLSQCKISFTKELRVLA